MAVCELARRLKNRDVIRLNKVLAISTNKGGVLKTSMTTNIAGVLAKQGKKVLIIDADNQGDAALSFGKNPDKFKNTLYDVMVDGIHPKHAVVKVHKNIFLLPSNDDMTFLEFDILTNPERQKGQFMLMTKSLAHMVNEYDHIIIDTPPNMGLMQGNILCFADQILIPFQPEIYSMRSLTKIIKAVKEFGSRYNPGLSILGVVATLVDNRTNLHLATMAECRKYCKKNNITVFNTAIPKSIKFANSIAYKRKPAVLTEKKNPLVHSYFELTKELFEHGKK